MCCPGEAEPALPPVSRLVREFVLEVKAAQNLLVIKTTVGSAQPVAAALDGQDWEEAIGTIAGDDTILMVCSDNRGAKVLGRPHSGDARLMASKLKTAILGATGYSGFELARILLRHPGVETPVMLQRSGEAAAEANLADMYPAISGNGGYPLQPWSWAELKRREIELLFLATPHEVSRALVPEAIAHGMRVVDLSGAWRLREAQNRAVYGFHDENAVTAADLMEKAVYGLPELNGDQLPGAALVANPGCYATSVILALAPLLAADIVDREKGIISDSKSGVSGAGKEATARTHFVSVADNLVRLLGLRTSPCRRNSRAVEAGFGRADFHSAPACRFREEFFPPSTFI